jgi:uncharacterized protein YbcI
LAEVGPGPGGGGGRSEGPHAGGKLLGEITSRVVSLTREHSGHGPVKAKTYLLDNLIVCMLSGGLTPVERTMVQAGESDQVLETRRRFQRVMEPRYREAIESLMGCRVEAVLGASHLEPDVSVMIFLVDREPTDAGGRG